MQGRRRTAWARCVFLLLLVTMRSKPLVLCFRVRTVEPSSQPSGQSKKKSPRLEPKLDFWDLPSDALHEESQKVVCDGMEEFKARLAGCRDRLYDVLVIQMSHGSFPQVLDLVSIVYGHRRPSLYIIHGNSRIYKYDKTGQLDKAFDSSHRRSTPLQQYIIEDILKAWEIDDLVAAVQPCPPMLQRNPLVEPLWLVDAVGQCFEHPDPQEPFPKPSKGFDMATVLLDRGFHSPSMPLNDLLCSIFYIFDSLGLLDELEIDKEVFRRFLLALHLNYKENPYHNFNHAVDVLQFTYVLLKETPTALRLLSSLEVFSLLFAAISHDVGHTSFNNAFHVQTDSLLALLFNDQSVLENYHCLLVFGLLRHAQYSFCARWPVDGERWRTFRRLVIACILGTDMGSHFDYVRRIDRAAFSEGLEELNQEGRTLLAIALIKSADISNIIRPWEVARKWGFKLVAEFFHQGDWERLLGHQPGLLTDRTACDLAKGQEHFMLQVAGPLFRSMAQAFPRLAFCVEALEANVARWRQWRPQEDELLAAQDDLRSHLCGPSDHQ